MRSVFFQRSPTHVKIRKAPDEPVGETDILESQSVLAAYRDPTGPGPTTRLGEAFGAIRTFHEFNTTPASQTRRGASVGLQKDFLLDGGGNLALILQNLQFRWGKAGPADRVPAKILGRGGRHSGQAGSRSGADVCEGAWHPGTDFGMEALRWHAEVPLPSDRTAAPGSPAVDLHRRAGVGAAPRCGHGGCGCVARGVRKVPGDCDHSLRGSGGRVLRRARSSGRLRTRSGWGHRVQASAVQRFGRIG